MCVVIDINVINAVFSEQNAKHSEFRAVKQWILKGKGKLVFGGSTYKRELKDEAVLSMIAELERSRKTVHVDDNKVDQWESRFKAMIPRADFDDPHLVAIFRVSRCLVFCSEDQVAGQYVQKRSFYPKRHPIPYIYKRGCHRRLLCDGNIAACCRC